VFVSVRTRAGQCGKPGALAHTSAPGSRESSGSNGISTPKLPPREEPRTGIGRRLVAASGVRSLAPLVCYCSYWLARELVGA